MSKGIKIILLLVLFIYSLVEIKNILWKNIKKNNNNHNVKECSLYLYSSTLEGTGSGVFAGRDFDALELIEYAMPAIHMNNEHISGTQLGFYCYESNGLSSYNFGVSNMLNHLPGAVNTAKDSVPPQPGIDFRTEANEQLMGFNIFSKVKIRAGEEIFNDFGEQWFKSRGMKEIKDLPSKKLSVIDLEQGGAQCLSHLYAKPSPIPMAGMGIFSKISYSEGDIVFTSPVLVLSKRHVRNYDDMNVLINYCISEDGSDAALIPTGLIGLLNHGSRSSNIRMEWSDSIDNLYRLNMSVRELREFQFAPIEISYIATTSIAEGEELLLDYGVAWHEKWIQHLDRLIEWNGDVEWSESNVDTIVNPSMSYCPQFREPIGAPHGLFPDHFKCTADDDCSYVASSTTRRAEVDKLLKESRRAFTKQV